MSEEQICESTTDVLIIGAGPSGLMAAYWMACCGIRARIVDKRGNKVFRGQADGLAPRAMEIFDSMGVHDRIMREGIAVVDNMAWARNGEGKLVRKGASDSSKLESPFTHMALNQGRIERFIVDSIQEDSSIEVERGVIAESLEYNASLENDFQAYPITVKLRTLNEEEANFGPNSESETARSGWHQSNLCPDDWNELIQQSKNRRARVETIKARFLIAGDGAHSWTRKQLNIPFDGTNIDDVWGAIDVIPITNYPDIRRPSIVANTAGTMLVFPRERQIVRVQVSVSASLLSEGKTAANGRIDRSAITVEMIRAQAQAILSPFYFDFEYLEWTSAYQVGQRIAPTFSKGNRVFLAGDAGHTNSPKVGLGMNMALQDSFNLGWKVALVAAGAAHPSILDTYNIERYPLAQMLLEFDRDWSRIFLEGESPSPEALVPAIDSVMDRFEEFADGREAYYSPSSLVWTPKDQNRPIRVRGLIPGERLRPVKLRNQAEGRTRWTTNVFRSNGYFRVVILAGDLRHEAQRQRVHKLSRFLAGQDETEPSKPFLRRYASLPGHSDSPIELITIHSGPWMEIEFFDFPEPLISMDTAMGWSYDAVWCDDSCVWDPSCDGKAYEKWGVDRTHGALLIVRPDQYVGWLGELEDVSAMTRYFDGVLMKPSLSEQVEIAGLADAFGHVAHRLS